MTTHLRLSSMEKGGGSGSPSASDPRPMSHRELGVLVGLASMGMLFATLILSYMLARARSPVWPPIGVDPVPVLLPALSTFLLLLSSFYVHLSYKRLLGADLASFKRFWNIGTVIGGLFVLLQGAVIYQLYSLDIKIDSHLFGSIVYTLIIFHAIHIVAGIAALVYIATRFSKYSATRHEGPRLVGWFWHFLDVVWLMMFVLIVWR